MTPPTRRRSVVAGPRRGFVGGPRHPVPSRERRLYTGGIAALTLHAPATSLGAIGAVVGLAALAIVVHPRLARRVRAVWSGALGLLSAGAFGVSDGLRVVTGGPGWSDASGAIAVLGGFALIASAAMALRSAPSWGRLGIAAAAASIACFVWLPLGVALVRTHAPRDPVSAGATDWPHRVVQIPARGALAAWYAPWRRRAAEL
jgi:hypothetical protein